MSLTHHNPPDKDREQVHRSQPSRYAEIRRSVEILADEGTVVEMRVFTPSGYVTSCYYNDHDALAADASDFDHRGYQVYVTLNQIGSGIQPRIINSTVVAHKTATADRDIVRRRWLLVDIDPVRTSDTSSTDEEKWAASHKAKEVLDYLREKEWPEPVIADSGNGFHLLYPIDLPNDTESRELVKGVLVALATRFDNDQVKIDTGVHNAARIVRLYGTTNRKGNSTEERPHRRSKIHKTPGKEVS